MRALAVLIWLWAGMAVADCRQALVLALDVSGSVNSAEYRLQVDGLANALAHPEVRAALMQLPQAPVEIMVFEWAGPRHQRVLIPWVALSDAAVLANVIGQLRGTVRSDMPPATGLGTAMARGLAELRSRPHCWAQTLDVSGDGKSNMGPEPKSVKPQAEAQGATINALVIGPKGGLGANPLQETGELQAYFSAYVIAGPGAFTEVAVGFDDYEAAMVRKLLRELQGAVLSQLAE